MKNQTLPLEVRQKIEGIKNGLIPQELVPNSRCAKNAELVQALIVLEYAKSQKRKVRKADPTECEFTRSGLHKTNVETVPDNYYTKEECAKEVGFKLTTINDYFHRGMISGETFNGKVYFPESEVMRLKATRRAKAANID